MSWDEEKRNHVLVSYAYCCSGSVRYCDCVNKTHGSAMMPAVDVDDDYPVVKYEESNPSEARGC